jgi:hypothetical protein
MIFSNRSSAQKVLNSLCLSVGDIILQLSTVVICAPEQAIELYEQRLSRYFTEKAAAIGLYSSFSPTRWYNEIFSSTPSNVVL